MRGTPPGPVSALVDASRWESLPRQSSASGLSWSLKVMGCEWAEFSLGLCALQSPEAGSCAAAEQRTDMQGQARRRASENGLEVRALGQGGREGAAGGGRAREGSHRAPCVSAAGLGVWASLPPSRPCLWFSACQGHDYPSPPTPPRRENAPWSEGLVALPGPSGCCLYPQLPALIPSGSQPARPFPRQFLLLALGCLSFSLQRYAFCSPDACLSPLTPPLMK